MIRGFSQTELSSRESIFLYKKMIKRSYPFPNSFTISFVLKACSIVSAFREGKQIHTRVVRSGFNSSPFVQTALTNFYAKCEKIWDAQKLFDEISEKNLVAWSTMISGYTKIGKTNEALRLFSEMQIAGVVPDEVTMVSVISACAASGSLEVGKWAHAFVGKRGINTDLELSTAIVNMYAKCGCIERAKKVFDAMVVKDAKAWSSMIVGLAIHGLAEEALRAFSRMEEAQVKPNHVTFIGVLAACGHNGLVSDGWRHWSRMLELGIEPSIELYGCMVDLLCRTGNIEEAYTFIKNMHIPPNLVIFRTLLVGCKMKKSLAIGEMAAKNLLELEPLNAENYILLSSFYASVSEWEKMSLVRKEMKVLGIKPIPGCSSIELDGFVHEFLMGDWSHPELKQIKMILNDIEKRVFDFKHEPGISSVLHDVCDEEKKADLCEHSERLAIAYGLLKTKAPVVIRVVKNLRVCGDCHEVTKIISKVYNREIIVRDRVRFHKFVNGVCSCRDFW